MISEKTTATASYSASAATIVAGLSINEWLAIVGVCTAIGTFAVNSWYKHLHYKLDKQRTEHATNGNKS